MLANLIVSVESSRYVPTNGRAAWLNKWGPQPKSVEVSLVAELETWERLSVHGLHINPDMTLGVEQRYSTYPLEHLDNWLRTTVEGLLSKDPTLRVIEFEQYILPFAEEVEAHYANKRAKELEDLRLKEEESQRNDRALKFFLTVDLNEVVDDKGNINIPEEFDAYRRSCEFNRIKDHSVSIRERIEKERIDKIRSWMLTTNIFSPHAKRAAAEGFDIKNLVKATLTNIIHEHFDDLGWRSANQFDGKKDTRPPTEEAYKIRDGVAAQLATLSEFIPCKIEGKIDGFYKYDISETRKKVWRTAISVSIHTEMTGSEDLGLAIFTEPTSNDEEDDEDDCDDDD